MAYSSLNSCKTLTIEGVLDDIRYKKSGRISRLIVLTKQGIREIKASKYLRLMQGYQPALQDQVKLKVLKKVKGDRVKLKAFELVLIQPARKRSRKACKPLEVSLCQSSSCRKRGSDKLRAKLEKALLQSDASHCRVTTSKCLGKCKAGPVAKVKPSGQVYSKLNSKTALSLLKP